MTDDPGGGGKKREEIFADKEESDCRRTHSQLYKKSWSCAAVASTKRKRVNRVLVDLHGQCWLHVHSSIPEKSQEGQRSLSYSHTR